MATASSDPITAAMIATEKEVAGFAWDIEDTDAADPSGDQSLEDMGEGLEGQHEAEAEGEEADGEAEGEVEAEPGKITPEPVAAKPIEPTRTETEGRVPPGRLREANERARAAEAERDTLKAAADKRDADTRAQLDLVMRELAALKTAPRPEPVKPADPVKPQRPDIFENPDGVYDFLERAIRDAVTPITQQTQNQRVETSLAIAHAVHKDVFEKAYGAMTALNPQDPEARATVQRIMAAPNPGDAMISWHKRNQTLAEVGDDPTAYRERIAKETREAAMKDPEFRKALLAEMRGEAANGADGQPRNVTKLPRSLAAAGGSNAGADRVDPNAFDGSPQAIADSAWR
jgi:hypothetical protein